MGNQLSTSDTDPPCAGGSPSDASEPVAPGSAAKAELGADAVVDALKSLYAKTLSEPIPARFMELLEQIDKATESAIADIATAVLPPDSEPLPSD